MTRRTAVGTAVVLVLAAGCTDDGSGSGDDATTSPSPDVTLSPVPTATATASPSASPTPTTSPTGPAAEADGCPPPREERAEPLPTADAAPTTGTRQVTQAPSGREIDVRLVTVETDGPVGEEITATLEQHVTQLISQWDETAGPPASEQDGENATPPPELQIELTPARVDETVVSVVLTGYEYLGGASGNGLINGWAFSTATGDELALADVGLDGPCLDELATLTADDLAARDVGMFGEAEAALRSGEISMDRWSLHDGSLHIHFPPYELAPGAAGPLTAELDLTAVRAATGTPLGADGD